MSGEDRKRDLLAELEKRKARAQRFGEPTEEIERKIQRIQRFGLEAADAAGVSKIGSELRGSKRGRTTAEEPPTKQKAHVAESHVSVRRLLTRKKSLLPAGDVLSASVFRSRTSMTRSASSAKRVLDLHPRRNIIAHTLHRCHQRIPRPAAYVVPSRPSTHVRIAVQRRAHLSVSQRTRQTASVHMRDLSTQNRSQGRHARFFARDTRTTT